MRATLGKDRYTIRVVPDVVEYCRSVDGDEDEIVKSGEALHGYIDYKRKEIVLKDGPHRQKASTLLHEMLHKVFWFLTEDVIAKGEEELFEILWKQGWRPFS